MTQTNCPLHQPRCGLQESNPICPKCGLDVRVRYVSKEDGQIAASRAEAQFWSNDAREVLADEQAPRKPGQVFKDLPESPQMVVVPSGSFLMGSETTGWFNRLVGWSETPQHQVTIAYQLAMGRYPVTFDEWDACVADGGTQYEPADQGWGRGKRPVINVSWDDAQAYILWLNNKLGIQAKDPHRYRLPSEAEWEYACRAGSQAMWCFGDDKGQLEEYAWYRANSVGKTHPVGQKNANEFGLYDIHGNVWEHIYDYGNNNYRGAPNDGAAWETGHKTRVLRGGSWDDYAKMTRSTNRARFSSSTRGIYLGFRLARTLP